MSNLDAAKLWYLNRINLLKGLPRDELEYIARCSSMERFKKGEIILFQGDLANHVYFLKEGRVKISRLGAEGREITLAILEQGEIFGETALSGVEKSDTESQALENTVLCVILKEDFLQVLERNARLALKLTKFIGFRRHEMERKLSDLVFMDVPSRLASLLLSLKERYGEKESHGVRLGIVLSHQELANLIGATRETVSAHLAQWKRDGIVDSEKRNLVLLNEAALQRLARVTLVNP